MKIKEKLANFKANFDAKFEKNKKTFYIFIPIFLLIFIWSSYISFCENKSFPKPLEYLYKVNGVVTSYSYSKKTATHGTLILKLDNGDFERFRIFSWDDEIYKKLKGKKAVIHASEATLLHKKVVKQIEDENGNILKKYDYDLAVKSTGFFSNIFAFCFNISTFLATILSFAIFYDINKQNKTKQGVKNG
ncbi:MAG: hypothetical protein SO144_04730 [Campylobacter sp.]|nr:hypothetical protein [Campylobacter sp.]